MGEACDGMHGRESIVKAQTILVVSQIQQTSNVQHKWLCPQS